MTDTKFKKALTIAEIAKMKPEDALQYNLNRMEYIEIKGMADAYFADGHVNGRQEADAEWQPLLEQERREKEQERREKEQERREKEQAQKVAEQERERYIITLKRFIEAGFSKETVAEINKITVSELEELLAEESL